MVKKLSLVVLCVGLSACSTNYGMYERGDAEHGKIGYVSSYLAIAAGVLLAGAVFDDDDSGSGGSGGGGAATEPAAAPRPSAFECPDCRAAPVAGLHSARLICTT